MVHVVYMEKDPEYTAENNMHAPDLVLVQTVCLVSCLEGVG
jgi:hypothetical protein